MNVIHFYSLYMNMNIMDYIETSYDKLLAITAVLYLQHRSFYATRHTRRRTACVYTPRESSRTHTIIRISALLSHVVNHLNDIL